jgi:hypothetical protein
MKFANTLDELHHWLGLLTIDIQLGVPQRHLNASLRLCWLLVDKLHVEQLSKQKAILPESVVTRVSIQLLDLQRAIAPKKPGPKEGQEPRGPRLRLVGQ